MQLRSPTVVVKDEDLGRLALHWVDSFPTTI